MDSRIISSHIFNVMTISTKPRKPMKRTAMTPKLRKCCVCKTNQVANIFAKLCENFECVVSYANKERDKRLEKEAKKQRKEIAIRKEKLKTRSDYIKEAQIAFNAYIRERDKNQLCICCDEPLGIDSIGGGYDCGHYRSVGSAPHLRFDERNAHAQRKKCNRYGAGRAVDYRLGLIRRLGLEAVEALESLNEPAKWTIEELKAIKAHYKAKTKELLRGKQMMQTPIVEYGELKDVNWLELQDDELPE